MCFNCNQKWSINHRCSSRMLLIVGDKEETDEIEIDNHNEEVILGDISSLNSLSGVENPRSLRMWRKMGNSSVYVLIDSGSTHNFIQPEVAAKLRTKVETVSPFRVYIGNGDSMPCQSYCPQVTLGLQGTDFNMDLFILPIQGPDIIFRVPWLQELGQVNHDYRSMSMEFKWNKKKVKLQVDETLGTRKVTFSQLEAMIDHKEVHELYELTWRQNSDVSNSQISGSTENIPENLTEAITKSHGGIKRTTIRIARQFYWSGLHKDVEKFMSECVVCQQVKVSTQSLAVDRPKSWGEFLCWAEYSYNTSFHSGLLMSPYQALYGRPPLSMLAYQRGTTRVQSLEEQLLLRDEMSVARRGFNKLAKKYYGPFAIVERIRTVAYRLELPDGSKIHPVFHVSLLRHFRGTTEVSVSTLLGDDVNGRPILTPFAVRDTKMVWQHGRAVKIVLIQWCGSPPEESTWEFESDMVVLDPDFHLEAKVLAPKGRDDTTKGVVGSVEKDEEIESAKNSIGPRRSARLRRFPPKLQD
ncbi:hypothetical protein C2S52_009174 [Perilla frutescens var. hirtella]|nr:hypothetical protein C2S52_009174 [Perilla frutescens var. hirtella]